MMRNLSLILSLVVIIAACSDASENTVDMEEPDQERVLHDGYTLPDDYPEDMDVPDIPEDLYPDQKERKARSMAYLVEHQVPTLDNLPVIHSEQTVTLRSKDEVVDRVLALCFIGLRSEGLEADQLARFDRKYNVTSKFSPWEMQFASTAEPDQQSLINANWRYEDMYVGLWALGYVDSLPHPGQACDVASLVGIIAQQTEDELRANAQMRSASEILDQLDLIYRMHWAVQNARVMGEPAPLGLDGSVVYEWHYFLNWITTYNNQDWDNVSPDT